MGAPFLPGFARSGDFDFPGLDAGQPPDSCGAGAPPADVDFDFRPLPLILNSAESLVCMDSPGLIGVTRKGIPFSPPQADLIFSKKRPPTDSPSPSRLNTEY